MALLTYVGPVSWARAASAGILALVLAGCGGATPRESSPHRALAPPTSGAAAVAQPTEVLAAPLVGSFYGRCVPGARRWTLRFAADPSVDDLVIYRLGGGRTRGADVRPGGTITWQLRPGAARSREPADPITRSPASTVVTTLPLNIVISQGSEPHIFRVDVHLALAAAIGDTVNCALVSTRLRALTYFSGGAPRIP